MCHGVDANVSAGNMRGTVLLQTNSSADILFVSVGSSHFELSVQLCDFSLVARPTRSTGAAVRVVALTTIRVIAQIPLDVWGPFQLQDLRPWLPRNVVLLCEFDLNRVNAS